MRRKDPPTNSRQRGGVSRGTLSAGLARPSLECSWIDGRVFHVKHESSRTHAAVFHVEHRVRRGGLAALSLTARKRRRYGGQDVDRREKADRESDQETDEVGSSVTGSASHRSIADSAAAVTITPPGRTSGANSSMVSAGSPGVGPPRHRGCRARRHHAPIRRLVHAQSPPDLQRRGAYATGVVEAPFRGVHETKFRMGEERRQNHSGKPAPVPTSTMRPWNSSNDAENDEHTARANQTVCSTSASTGAVPMTPAARAGVQASSSEAS